MSNPSNVSMTGATVEHANFGTERTSNITNSKYVSTGDNATFNIVEKTEIRGKTDLITFHFIIQFGILWTYQVTHTDWVSRNLVG